MQRPNRRIAVLFCVSQAMMSGLETTAVMLTACQTYAVRCSQVVLPCCHCSAHQTGQHNTKIAPNTPGGAGGGGGWHRALLVGSVSLWRRLLASRP